MKPLPSETADVKNIPSISHTSSSTSSVAAAVPNDSRIGADLSEASVAFAKAKPSSSSLDAGSAASVGNSSRSSRLSQPSTTKYSAPSSGAASHPSLSAEDMKENNMPSPTASLAQKSPSPQPTTTNHISATASSNTAVSHAIPGKRESSPRILTRRQLSNTPQRDLKDLAQPSTTTTIPMPSIETPLRPSSPSHSPAGSPARRSKRLSNHVDTELAHEGSQAPDNHAALSSILSHDTSNKKKRGRTTSSLTAKDGVTEECAFPTSIPISKIPHNHIQIPSSTSTSSIPSVIESISSVTDTTASPSDTPMVSSRRSHRSSAAIAQQRITQVIQRKPITAVKSPPAIHASIIHNATSEANHHTPASTPPVTSKKATDATTADVETPSHFVGHRRNARSRSQSQTASEEMEASVKLSGSDEEKNASVSHSSRKKAQESTLPARSTADTKDEEGADTEMVEGFQKSAPQETDRRQSSSTSAAAGDTQGSAASDVVMGVADDLEYVAEDEADDAMETEADEATLKKSSTRTSNNASRDVDNGSGTVRQRKSSVSSTSRKPKRFSTDQAADSTGSAAVVNPFKRYNPFTGAYSGQSVEEINNYESMMESDIMRDLELIRAGKVLDLEGNVIESSDDDEGVEGSDPAIRGRRKAAESSRNNARPSSPVCSPGDEKLVASSDDYCAACLGKGRLLCCDSCPRVFHFACVEEGFDAEDLIEGSWECKSCAYKRRKNVANLTPTSSYSEMVVVGEGIAVKRTRFAHPKHLDIPAHIPPDSDASISSEKPRPPPAVGNRTTTLVSRRHLFTPLLDHLDSINPRSFELPPDLIQEFDGVMAHPATGDYIDLNETEVSFGVAGPGRPRLNGGGGVVVGSLNASVPPASLGSGAGGGGNVAGGLVAAAAASVSGSSVHVSHSGKSRMYGGVPVVISGTVAETLQDPVLAAATIVVDVDDLVEPKVASGRGGKRGSAAGSNENLKGKRTLKDLEKDTKTTTSSSASSHTPSDLNAAATETKKKALSSSVPTSNTTKKRNPALDGPPSILRKQPPTCFHCFKPAPRQSPLTLLNSHTLPTTSTTHPPHVHPTSTSSDLIRCSHCHTWWHLDCLNPPLACVPHELSEGVESIDVRKVRDLRIRCWGKKWGAMPSLGILKVHASAGGPLAGTGAENGKEKGGGSGGGCLGSEKSGGGAPMGTSNVSFVYLRKRWKCPLHAEQALPAEDALRHRRRRKGGWEALGVVDLEMEAAEMAVDRESVSSGLEDDEKEQEDQDWCAEDVQPFQKNQRPRPTKRKASPATLHFAKTSRSPPPQGPEAPPPPPPPTFAQPFQTFECGGVRYTVPRVSIRLNPFEPDEKSRWELFRAPEEEDERSLHVHVQERHLFRVPRTDDKVVDAGRAAVETRVEELEGWVGSKEVVVGLSLEERVWLESLRLMELQIGAWMLLKNR
ncbi:hypothetical protein HDV05_002245 [Chytridiales sp. JEL 0842]|nr:hypothetical protein HDV05_002245 [Chytridiales sp. JEL 0842]